MKKWLACAAGAPFCPPVRSATARASFNLLQHRAERNYYLAYCFAQVHNNASTVICLDRGTFDLQSGETLLSTSGSRRFGRTSSTPARTAICLTSFPSSRMKTAARRSLHHGHFHNLTYLPVDAAFAKLRPFGGFGNRSGRLRHSGCDLPPDQFDEMDAITRPWPSAQRYGQRRDALFGRYDAPGRGYSGRRHGAESSFRRGRAFVAQWQSYGAMPTQVHTNASFRRRVKKEKDDKRLSRQGSGRSGR